MIRLFLCEARRQIRSIVSLCEEFGDRSSRAKRVNQNDFYLSVAHSPAAPPYIIR